MSSATTSGTITRTTIFDYWPTGLLKKSTQPDGSFINCTYNSAQRLTGISDGLGNSVTFTLDNASNRISEQVKDAGGVLKRNISRTFDTLNQLKTVTGALQ